MDVRASSNLSQEEFNKQEDSKLTDALIFNIIKKIELKMAMEDKFEEQRVAIVKMLPQNIGKHLYSPVAIGYFLTVMIGTTYLRYKARRKLTFQAFVPHFVIAFTINQLERYNGIMSVNSEMKNEYRTYQRNTAEIIAEKKKRISLLEMMKNSKIVTFDKLMEMVKFKPVY